MSTPLTSAGISSPPSSKLTVTESAPSTTCALVRIVPSLLTTKPEPVAEPSWGVPKGDDSSEVTPSAEMKATPRPSEA